MENVINKLLTGMHTFNLSINLDNLYLVFLLLLLGCVTVLTITPKIKKQTRIKLSLDKVNTATIKTINKSKRLKWIKDYLTEKISVATDKYSVYNESQAILFMVAYVVIALAIYLLLQIYARVWYTHMLNALISLSVPAIAISIYLSAKQGKVDKELPDAIDELRSMYMKHKRVEPSIKEASKYMPKYIGREFDKLGKNMKTDFDGAIEKMKRRLRNPWIHIILILLKINKYEGGDIIPQLDYINNVTTQDIIERKKANMRFLMLKLASLGAVVLALGVIFVNVQLSPVLKDYYTTNIMGINNITKLLISALFSFVFVMALEKV